MNAPTAEELRIARVGSALRSALSDLNQAQLDMAPGDPGAHHIGALKAGIQDLLDGTFDQFNAETQRGIDAARAATQESLERRRG